MDFIFWEFQTHRKPVKKPRRLPHAPAHAVPGPLPTLFLGPCRPPARSQFHCHSSRVMRQYPGPTLLSHFLSFPLRLLFQGSIQETPGSLGVMPPLTHLGCSSHSDLPCWSTLAVVRCAGQSDGWRPLWSLVWYFSRDHTGTLGCREEEPRGTVVLSSYHPKGTSCPHNV